LTYSTLTRQINGTSNATATSSTHRAANVTQRSVSLPAAVDWRTRNAVTPVKNQRLCGSCWAFSSLGALEGAVAIATGTLQSLSEGQLIDCSRPQGNAGCDGGLITQAYQYILSNGGVASLAAYPTVPDQTRCTSAGVTSVAHMRSFVELPVDDEFALLAAVALGPVSVGIESDSPLFQFYSGGILSADTCGSDANVNHAVVIVGYGTDAETAQDYYIVKNSWSVRAGAHTSSVRACAHA
jgi:cathepsin L